jgi:GT2 family glycosyltransferase
MLTDEIGRLLNLKRKPRLPHFQMDDQQLQALIESTPFALYGQLDDKTLLIHQVNESRMYWCSSGEAPLVSIIVPLFKSNPVYLEKAIQSVLCQSYPEWELVLIDDASPGSEHLKIVSQYQDLDPQRIRLIRREQNGGISASRNDGIATARGDYIAFLDHDDVLHPLALSETMKPLISENANFAYSFEVKLSSDGNHLKEFLSKPVFSWFTLLHLNYVCHFSVIKRSLLDAVATAPGVYFHAELDGAEDHDLFLRCSCAPMFKVLTVPLFLYLWRMAPESTSSNQENKPESFRRNVISASRYLKDDPYSFQEGKALHPFRSHTVIQPRVTSENSRILVLPTGPLSETETGYKQNLVDQNLVQIKLKKRDENSSALSAAELNVAIRKSSKPYVLIMHPSIDMMKGDFLAGCIAWLERFSEIGTVGASIIDVPRVASRDSPNFVPESYAVHSAYHIDETSAVGGGFRFSSFYGKRWFAFESREVIANTKHFMLFRRDDFLAAGGFCADRFLKKGYDLDFCLRLRALGKIHINLGAGSLFGEMMDECKMGYGEPEYTSIIESCHMKDKIFQLSYNLAYHINNISAATDGSISRC